MFKLYYRSSVDYDSMPPLSFDGQAGPAGHVPGVLVNAAHRVLHTGATWMSYLEGKYNKVLVEAQVASWDILQMPAVSNDFATWRLDMPTEHDLMVYLGYRNSAKFTVIVGLCRKTNSEG